MRLEGQWFKCVVCGGRKGNGGPDHSACSSKIKAMRLPTSGTHLKVIRNFEGYMRTINHITQETA